MRRSSVVRLPLIELFGIGAARGAKLLLVGDLS